MLFVKQNDVEITENSCSSVEQFRSSSFGCLSQYNLYDSIIYRCHFLNAVDTN